MPSLLPLKWDAGSPRWADLGAGLCVAGLLLPEAVAYAGLARLPVEHALVAILVGLAVYAVSGGSRFAIVAPTSSAATLAAAATLLSGGVLVILSWARQGQLAAFVSRPVLRSFAFALAITMVLVRVMTT
jgi:SulP family sulfate permease